MLTTAELSWSWCSGINVVFDLPDSPGPQGGAVGCHTVSPRLRYCVHFYIEECSFSSVFVYLPVVSFLPRSLRNQSTKLVRSVCESRPGSRREGGRGARARTLVPALSRWLCLWAFSASYLVPESWDGQINKYTVWISKMLLALLTN